MVRIMLACLAFGVSQTFIKAETFRDLRVFGPKVEDVFTYVAVDNGQQGYGVRLKDGSSLEIRSELKGDYAVYISMVTPSPRISSEWEEQTFSIAPNARFYHGVTEPFPVKSSIRNGGVYAVNPAKEGEVVTQEIFAGYGKFSDSPLIIRGGHKPALITSIRFRLLSEQDLLLLSHKNDPSGNRRVVYNNDGFSEGFGEEAWQPAEIYRQIDRFKDSDCERIDYQTVSAGAVQFPSKYLDFYGQGVEKFARDYEKNVAENYREMERDGLPLYPTITNRGREIGVPVWGAQRMNAYYGNHPFGWSLNGEFWRSNQEKFGLKAKSGELINGRGELSYAYKEIRDQKMGVLKELVEMGCDGVTLDFHTPNVFGYETPLIEAFQKKYGEDPRDLPENDPRWQRLRCEVMNNYLREIREEMNSLGEKLGKKIGICVRLPAVDPERYGYDPRTWIKEKLVDMLVPGEAFGNMEVWYDIKPWVEMAKGSETKVYGNIEYFINESSHTELTDEEVESGVQPGVQTIYTKEDYLHRAAELYNSGADGLYLYNNFMREPASHISLNQLGDKIYVQKWSEFEDPRNQGSEIIKLIQ